eukprot:scaffold43441_cov31-Tisochrysis_lutea.AAC.3
MPLTGPSCARRVESAPNEWRSHKRTSPPSEAEKRKLPSRARHEIASECPRSVARAACVRTDQTRT